MYPISSDVKALFEAEQRQVLRITGTDKNGATISITDENVMMNGFEIDRFCSAGSKLEIGNAIASELSLKLDNRQGQFNDIVFEGAELFVEVGIADWTQASPTVNWIPCGYFTCDEQPRTLSTITIHALDRMMRFDRTVDVLNQMPWTDENGTPIEDGRGNIIYFNYGLIMPMSIERIVITMAGALNVPFTQDISAFPNAGFMIYELPVLQQRLTCRMLLQWCAGIMGTNAWVDWTGALRFSWYDNTTDYVTTTANRFSSDLFENDISITGVVYTNLQNVTIVSGSSEYALDLTGNYLAANGIAEILPNLSHIYTGFSYRPFVAEVVNAPYLWPMDVITFNKNGVDHSCVLTNVNFGINGTTAIESKGQTAQTNSNLAPNGVTTEQAFLIEQAAEISRELDDSLTQEGIFNLLTDNGAAQGMYLINGQVYVNMSYARSGTLVLGGLNNQNGLLRVLDADGNEIGQWGKDGIVLNKGVIQGLFITLGGLNNQNGEITILNSSGSVIGKWNNEGLSVTEGVITNSSITLDDDGLYLGNTDIISMVPPGSLTNVVGWTGTTSNGMKFYNGILYEPGEQ